MTSAVTAAGDSAAVGIDAPVRLPVDVYRHDTGERLSAVWTLLELLAAIRRHRPGRPTASDTTFMVGERPRYLAISTDGPRAFVGQRPVWRRQGGFGGVVIFTGLSVQDVRLALQRFYAGESTARCFRGHGGRLRRYGAGSDWAST